MNTALHIVLSINFSLAILACGETPPPKSVVVSLPPLATSPMVEAPDSTIPQKLPLLTGDWKGIGKDRGRIFTWAVTNGQLEGTYQANKKVKEDYSKRFRFRIQDGVLCCFPGSYGGKCGTPDGTYRLTEQTDSNYTFLADLRPVVKTVSTLKFSFAGQNQMTFELKHDYTDNDYPDYHIARRFQREK